MKGQSRGAKAEGGKSRGGPRQRGEGGQSRGGPRQRGEGGQSRGGQGRGGPRQRGAKAEGGQAVVGKHPDLMVGQPTSTVFPTNDRIFEISQFFAKNFEKV